MKSTDAGDHFVTTLTSKLRRIYTANSGVYMVAIPRETLADILVALLDEEMTARRREEMRKEMEAREKMYLQREHK